MPGTASTAPARTAATEATSGPHPASADTTGGIALIAVLEARNDSLPPPARAQANKRILDWPVPLDTIHVVGRRPTRVELLARESAFVTRIEVAAARRPFEGVAELLDRSVGVQVTRYGGPGAMATLSIRGANPGEVEIFLDRTPLRSATQGVVDLSALDLSQVAAVEIYRSAPPSDLGGRTAGSAVRLVTHEPAGPHFALRASSGSYGTREFSQILSGAFDRHHYFVSLSHFRTDGDFRYFNDNATAYETSDDAWLRWTNGDAARQTLFAKLALAPARGLHLDLATDISTRDQGLPGTTHQPTERVRLQTKSRRHRVELATDGRGHRDLDLRLYGFDETTDRSYRDPLRELDLLGVPSRVDQDQTRRGGGLHLCWTTMSASPWIGAHSFECLGEWGAERLQRVSLPGRPTDDRRERRSRLLSIGDHWDPLNGRVRVSAFHRWDRTSDNFTGSDPYRPFAARPEHTATVSGPRLGLRVTLDPCNTLKANYARQARFPTFTELFGYEGAMLSNPDLQPETGWRADLGWIWTPFGAASGMRLRVEQVYYESRLDDMIVFVLVSSRETKPFNLDRAHIRGYELSIELDQLPGLRDLDLLPAIERWARRRLAAGATTAAASTPSRTAAALTLHLDWQDARDEGASPVYHGKQLPYHPPAEAQAQLDLTQGRWEIDYALQYRAGAFWGRSNLSFFETPAQWRHDLALRCRVARALRLGLRIENLLGAEIEDLRGYPLPERSWYGEVEWHPLAGANEMESSMQGES
ncbi:MAG: TonB-dependent receptor [Candidatus Eisenbacteria sp.]|nr:TonB-dependent receptor [Candidatus Eisenbacteria bacterium]